MTILFALYGWANGAMLVLGDIVRLGWSRFRQPPRSPERANWEARQRSVSVWECRDGYVIRVRTHGERYMFTTPRNISQLVIRMLRYQADPELSWDSDDSAEVLAAIAKLRESVRFEREEACRGR